MVELFGPDRRHQAEEAEHHRTENAENGDRPKMVGADMNARPQQHYEPEREPDQPRARDRRAYPPSEELADRTRQHPEINEPHLQSHRQQREPQNTNAVPTQRTKISD